MVSYITFGSAKQEFIFKWVVRKDRPFNFKPQHVGEVVSFIFPPDPINDETRKNLCILQVNTIYTIRVKKIV